MQWLPLAAGRSLGLVRRVHSGSTRVGNCRTEPECAQQREARRSESLSATATECHRGSLRHLRLPRSGLHEPEATSRLGVPRRPRPGQGNQDGPGPKPAWPLKLPPGPLASAPPRPRWHAHWHAGSLRSAALAPWQGPTPTETPDADWESGVNSRLSDSGVGSGVGLPNPDSGKSGVGSRESKREFRSLHHGAAGTLTPMGRRVRHSPLREFRLKRLFRVGIAFGCVLVLRVRVNPCRPRILSMRTLCPSHASSNCLGDEQDPLL